MKKLFGFLLIIICVAVFANDSLVVNLPGSIPLVMIKCPAGSYQMGSIEPTGSPWSTCDYTYSSCDKPAHTVAVKGFYIGKYELTQRQWAAVAGNNPAFFTKAGLDAPVEQVSWRDCRAFIYQANQNISRMFQLRFPTEAEWEYACRAGTTTRYPFADTSTDLSLYAWWAGNGTGGTHAVGMLKPNAWGLYDMLGNVYEWCADAWNIGYTGSPNDGSAWLAGDTLHRVTRGSWQGTSGGIQDFRLYTSFFRTSHSDTARHGCCGVRLAMNSPTVKAMKTVNGRIVDKIKTRTVFNGSIYIERNGIRYDHNGRIFKVRAK